MFWWLLALPVIFIMVFWVGKKKEVKWSASGNPAKIRSLMNDPTSAYREYRQSLWTIALLLLIIALANLQMGAETEKVNYKGSNVIVALDLSNSMLARDVAPDRLERAKSFVSRLVEQLGGDRVAFIVFAGKAYLQLPFTTDYSAVELQLRSISTDMMPTQGTALGEAIQMTMSMPVSADQKEKILVLISDGEDHDSEAISLAKKAAGKGISIYTIGVGTDKGGYIPEYYENGNIVYKRDRSGNIVLSKLNEDNLRKIAQAGGDQYFNINNEKKAIREIKKAIKWSASGEGEERIYTRYKSYYQWFLLPAILLLMLEMLLFKGVSIRLLKRKALSAAVTLLVISGFSSCKQPVNSAYTKAFQQYNEGNYLEAGLLFKEVVSQDTTLAKAALFNISAAYQAAQQYDSALYYLDTLLAISPDTMLSHICYFNKGNIFFEQRKFQEAVRMFEGALKLNPGHYRSQYNLCLALAHIQPSPEQDQQQQQQQEQPKDKEKNQQNKEENKDDKKENSQKDASGNDGKEKPDEQQKNSEHPKDKPSDKDKQDKHPSKPGSKKINAADLDRLFQQLDREERAVQKRVYQQAGQNSYKPTIEKDW
jgi:Ca-activated chloride channel family protein